MTTTITQQLIENQHYELVPSDAGEFWNVRILAGEYSETVITFGAISINEKTSVLTFDFSVDYSPDDGVSSDDPGLQSYAAHILHSVLVDSIEHEQSRNSDPS